ncbi:MAG TPA: hypothetical protein VKD90_12570 [Gemmataceae bacterium]|nr:hypothetical protein [Gemmataceae bacterium]
MSRTQRFFRAIMPRSWFESAEADSKTWMVRCPCGAERSVWDLGGIRWKAKGSPRWLMRCCTCGRRRWHKVEKATAT